jgi:small subunit ribosomal protein S16
VSVHIRLKRFGTKKRPYYRIVVVDSRSPRDGRVIEEVGLYHPIEKEDKQIALKADRIKEWLDKGATPTAVVKKILNRKARAQTPPAATARDGG